MKKFPRALRSALLTFGLDFNRLYFSFRGLPGYLATRRALRKQQQKSAEPFPFGRPCPCLADRHMESGSIQGHYFHQDLLVARRIFLNNPQTHFDVGSRIDGFIAHVASFRKVQVLDIRPLTNRVANVEFLQADLMQPIVPALVGVSDSLSCLHTLEHFGLGRYGDPINYEGHLVGFANLTAMLKTGGRLYFSVPIGPQRIEFNAHRVFSISYLVKLFQGRFEVRHFSFVDDAGDLHEDVALTPALVEYNCGCQYGCGIFELTKL